MRIQHYIDSFHTVTRRHKVGLRHFEPEVPSEKHCLFLHGWASDSTALRHMQKYMQDTPSGTSWHLWKITYDTTWQSYVESAKQIRRALDETGHDFEKTILIGYSMGGLVARQLVADGFPCEHLVTLCTPHHGTVPWMPLPMRGPRSLAHWGHHVRRLDKNPRDVMMRSRYHFFGITYKDSFGPHDHDGMVPRPSAMGEYLGDVATRRVIKLVYEVPVSAVMPVDPHWRGMFPRFCASALDHVHDLMVGCAEKGMRDEG